MENVPSSALGLLKLMMATPWLAMDMVTADAPVPRPCATVNTVGYPKQNVACNAQLAPMDASVRVEETADTMWTQPSLNVIVALGAFPSTLSDLVSVILVRFAGTTCGALKTAAGHSLLLGEMRMTVLCQSSQLSMQAMAATSTTHLHRLPSD